MHSAVLLEASFIISERVSMMKIPVTRSMRSMTIISMAIIRYRAPLHADKEADEKDTQDNSHVQAVDVNCQLEEKGKGQDSIACVDSSVDEGDVPFLRVQKGFGKCKWGERPASQDHAIGADLVSEKCFQDNGDRCVVRYRQGQIAEKELRETLE